MGRETYKVSVDDLFVANRRKVVERMRSMVDHAKGVIFLKGGTSELRYDSDHEPIFRQESYFWYLTGTKEPDCCLGIDIRTGHATLFIPKLPASYATIMGKIRQPEDWKAIYRMENVCYTEDVEEYLVASCNDRHGREPMIFLLNGWNSDSGKPYEPPAFIGSHSELSQLVDKHTLFPILAECRVIKSAAEISLMRHVTEVTSFAHTYTMRNMKPGMMEYQGESLFRHYCYYNYGCRLVGYTPICGCGPNAAVLHYGHAGEPNARQSIDGDMCLFDIGAEYFGYGSDVTCSFPINGRFTEKQRNIFTAVLQAQITVYKLIRPGVSWVSCHEAAERTILNHLIEVGIVIRGDKSVDELVEMRLGAVFMPHGLGHFIGIDTHDVGGYLTGHPQRIQRPGLKSLRTARLLEENMILTVEPGCYFVDHLLDDALSIESPLRDHLDRHHVDSYRGFGGVRLEDVIQVTSSGCINLTLCPRTINEIESVMAGGKWPPLRDEAPELLRVRLQEQVPPQAPESR